MYFITQNGINNNMTYQQVKTAAQQVLDASKLNQYTPEFCKYLFDSCICIGDSMTEGTSILPDNTAYPSYLAKMTGWAVTNAGFGGITTSVWWDTKFANYTYTNYDVAIICLGQNAGLTNTLAADTASGVYATYANTNTGDYCKIIEGLRVANPNIKIFLLKRFDGGDQWAVVDQIAAKYSVPAYSFVTNGVVDLTNVNYHPNSDTVHFGSIGNVALASVVYKNIAKHVYDNQAAFATYKQF